MNRVKSLNTYKIYLALLLVFLSTVFSNKQMGWQDGMDLLQADDLRNSYESITKSAPNFPTTPIAFHHAQRFLPFYLVGSFSKITKIKSNDLYLLFSYFLMLATFFLLAFVLRENRVTESSTLIICALLAWNPYSFRYYMLVPGMIADLGAVFFLLLCCFAMQRDNFPLFLLAILFGAAFRQTVLFALPAFSFWIFYERKKIHLSYFKITFLWVSLAFLYFLVKEIIRPFSLEDRNISYTLGLFSFLLTKEFDMRSLAELVIRAIIPLALTWIFILFGFFQFSRWRNIPPKVYFLILVGFSILAQPILAGPYTTGKNAGRLAALSLIPFLLAAGHLMPRKELNAKQLFSILLILFVASLHHLQTKISLPSPLTFLIAQIICCSALAITLSVFFSKGSVAREGEF